MTKKGFGEHSLLVDESRIVGCCFDVCVEFIVAVWHDVDDVEVEGKETCFKRSNESNMAKLAPFHARSEKSSKIDGKKNEICSEISMLSQLHIMLLVLKQWI